MKCFKIILKPKIKKSNFNPNTNEVLTNWTKHQISSLGNIIFFPSIVSRWITEVMSGIV